MRVYLSSTFADLQEYRNAVRKVLLRMGLEFSGMEDFGASESSPLEKCLEEVSKADLFILLLAYRYGYIPPNNVKSIIELEYESAKERQIPILAFLAKEDHPWPPKFIESGHQEDLLQNFKRELLNSLTVAVFTTPDDLASKVVVSVSATLGTVTRIPVEPPKLETITLADLLEEIRKLRSEISLLQQLSAQPSPNVRVDSDMAKATNSIQPVDFLGAAKPINHEQCFVIMPYSERWSESVQKILSEICDKVGVQFVIAKSMSGRFIPNDIWQGITGSGIIIADLSSANPNVTYEIGLADVLGREVILICQGEKVPFDFLGQRLILYEDSIAGTLKLREELTDRLMRFKASQETKEKDGAYRCVAASRG